ncbi:MAG: DUF2706 domain-containing protein [Rickettsiales bacterium]|nr:DUF2706 domain-containing protein [Pseudomonadota bacterium]MDA0966272.1 DUF2706 domain-containing protein [Pseudomonadota bacterium]MDG4543063.1 DUF2706 domain-containing protein [Rickettsiales bacterium]MDG4545261.1 DUF2706 domain-containing protein [Rickettsiales bacterium]MDG4547710.1 DUF2706 domain-containing protein [Rickettsiales bacterium]
MKYIYVVLMLLFIQGCAKDDSAKYDLKSPCVSADTDNDAPCQKRSPKNQAIG